ncbi:MAG: 3-deoxy-manno-octulosonate cytidylyltransferase [Campylobacterota bacterium]|nr:3-deoxy-manno-octulosonate cytidylyltransferase [Campylobacterota bacterium]
MDSKISLLDCTLRDGGYINSWEFSNKYQYSVIKSLIDANIQFIECGYLNEKIGKKDDSTLYDSIESINSKISTINALNSKFIIMINIGDYDVEKLPKRSDVHISGIRLAFHKKDINKAYEIAQKIIDKGYDLFVQPMVSMFYSDIEILNLIAKFNKLNIYAYYIVDSFGSMSRSEFKRLYYLLDNNLNKNIILGYHGHNNMQLAYSNAMDMVEMISNRDIVIDSSVFGMGRGAGNLNTEIFIDYLNLNYNANYIINPLLEIIDNYLESIYNEHKWGFSVAYYLSAIYNCHPNYANFFINKKTLTMLAIEKLLNEIDINKKVSFDSEYAHDLYIQFTKRNSQLKLFPSKILKGKKILLVASGNSVIDHINELVMYTNQNNIISISLNHVPSFVVDYYYFSNQKRYIEFVDKMDPSKVIVSSNILTHQSHRKSFSIAYDDNLIKECKFSDNVASSMLNYLVKKKIEKVYIAGLDGYSSELNNYYYDETDQILDRNEKENRNKNIACFIKHYSQKLRIKFITPTIFSKELSIRILGIIPARYKSSRFKGKPLALINGIPMLKRTYNQAIKSKKLDALVVATEDEKIEEYCKSENIPVIMTSPECLTGTDRLAEVSLSMDYDLYINIQGDEPVINPSSIDEVVSEYIQYGNKYIAYNLYKVVKDETEINSSTIIKVIVNTKDELLYMSRLPVPYSKINEIPMFKKQVCVYGFTKNALKLFSEYSKTLNEKFEDIEILRFLDLGYKIKMRQTKLDSISVDIPSDILKVEQYLLKREEK